MTPKEKATELTMRYVKCKDKEKIYYVIPIAEDAKQCALISLDETLNVLWNLYDNSNTSDSSEIIIKEQIDFLDEVKTEIENL
jgi:hypothetical protein